MKHLLMTLLLGLSGLAFAHTEVTALPPAHAAPAHAPRAVVLAFSEPVDLHFCTFKVYPLASGEAALSPVRLMALLNARGDENVRADTGAPKQGLAARLHLPLKPQLRPGNYAVIWRVLSDDGHVVTGQSAFKVQ